MTIGKLMTEGFPFKFPAGETQVRIGAPAIYSNGVVTFSKKVRSGDDIMEVLLTADALRRNGYKRIKLQLPYVPYARQDRVMVEGEALGIKVFADLLNSCNFEEVEIWDPHSDVTTALINNVIVVPQEKLLPKDFYKKEKFPCVLVCPDAGARKKILKVAAELENDQVIFADKVRDPATGKITGTKVDFSGVTIEATTPFLIVDDICERGGTFIGIAAAIQRHYPTSTRDIYLHVTHGMFPDGLDEIAKYFKGVSVTNMMNSSSEVINHAILLR
jgi:ribose-phosphate pyrophosphokinase